MKKWSLWLLLALLLMPMSAKAEDLPEVLGAVAQGIEEGLHEGAASVSAASQELTLVLTAKDMRIEEGHTLLLTIEAGNPYPTAADVTLTLDLPERLSCTQGTTWNAQLAPAQLNAQTGEFVPSSAAFTREVTLLPGGGSASTELFVEMAMGTRFYRAALPLELCVPHIAAAASIEGTPDQRVQPGDAFVYLVEVVNDGTAPKDVPVSLLLPDAVTPERPLPAGFTLRNNTVVGAVHVDSMGSSAVRLPMSVDADALKDDADACRLLHGALTVDEDSVALPMLKAVSPMISARLTPQKKTLEEGETTEMIITVSNTGLAPADVEISCLLPKGLTVLHDLTKLSAAQSGEDRDDTDEQLPAAISAGDGVPPADGAAQAVMSDAPAEPVIREKDGLLLLSLHMDAARETDEGAAAATREVALRVRADMPIDDVNNRLIGASVAWKTNGGETRLGEAVALEVSGGSLLGLSHSEWNGILLAALLMLITVCCLYSAVRSDSKQDDYCFE